MKTQISQRIEKAEKKAKLIKEFYDNMSLDEKLIYMREHPQEHKKNRNILNRYYNLLAREMGYSGGMEQFIRENKK